MRSRALGFFALGSLAISVADGQSVIASRAGLINYLEGDVLLDGQRLERNFGRYSKLKQGSDLVTRTGRVEVLLGPDTYLRAGENSAIRMLSDSLTDTRVELLSGSAILDSAVSGNGARVTVIFRNSAIRSTKPGTCRIDAEPAQLRVYRGEVEIAANGKVSQAGPSTLVPLDGGSLARRFTEGSDGLLELWSDERRMLVSSKLVDARSMRDPLLDPDPIVTGALDGYLGYLPPVAVLSLNPAPVVPSLAGSSYGFGGYGGLGYGFYGNGLYSYGYPGVPLFIPSYRPALGYGNGLTRPGSPFLLPRPGFVRPGFVPANPGLAPLRGTIPSQRMTPAVPQPGVPRGPGRH